MIFKDTTIKLHLKCLAAIATWLIWRHTGSVSFCMLNFLMAFVVISSIKQRNLSLPLIVGEMLNASVTLVNGGSMPVVGLAPSFIAPAPIWHVAQANDRLLFLADHISMYSFSIGDLVLLVGLAVFGTTSLRKIFVENS
jgi:hypothetical protein